MLHYLPGCDVRKNHPREMDRITRYMQSKGALIEACCRTKESFLGKEDWIVQNCTMCELVLKETQTFDTCLSLYEYVLMDDQFPWPDHSGESITIQDCVRTKDNRALQNAVRECLRKMNFTIIEMEASYDKADYCGIWRYTPLLPILETLAPNAMNHLKTHVIEILPEEEKEKKMKERIHQYPAKNVVVYCNGCEKGLLVSGMKPIHLVELLSEKL